jgi:1-acyl-sn-glycerol-3-phosphate acyltransferase
MSTCIPPLTIRRGLAPLAVVLEVLALLLFAGAAIVFLLAWPVTRRRRGLRVVSFGCVYLVVELAVLATCFWYWLRRLGGRLRGLDWDEAHVRMLDRVLSVLARTGESLLGFRLHVTEPPDTDPLDGDRPVLVLARHGGPGDSLAVVHLLLGRYRRRVRVVLKNVLALDPALDILLTRLKCVFLPGGKTVDSSTFIAAAAADMGDRDVLLIFPEGGNWTPGRQARAIDRLRRNRAFDKARVAEQLDYLLPPRSAGVLASLVARPGLEIVFVAHTGLEELVTLREVWDHLPFEVPMSLRWWKTGLRPNLDDCKAVDDWLNAEWAVIEEWIGIQADLGQRLPPQPGASACRPLDACFWRRTPAGSTAPTQPR